MMTKLINRLSVVIFVALFSQQCFCADTKLNIVLDTSGSMARYNEKIAESILEITEHNSTFSRLTENIKLFSFTEQAKFELKGDSLGIFSSIKSITAGGGTEDGLIPLKKIILDPAVKDTHIILFTDEGRDVVDHIDVDNLISLAREKNITIHSVLCKTTFCVSNSAIGPSEQRLRNGINKQSEYCHQTDNQKVRSSFSNANANEKNTDYVNISLSTGGMVWSMSDIYGDRGDLRTRDGANKSAKLSRSERNKQSRTLKEKECFSSFIATELYNSYERLFAADISIAGELDVGNTVVIDASVMSIKQGAEIFDSWEWDLDNDGNIDDFGPAINFNLSEQGNHVLSLWLSGLSKGKKVRIKQEVSLVVN